MAGALARCAKCGARRYESEVIYSSAHKDFICKNPEQCLEGTTKHAQLKKLKLRRMKNG